MEINSVHFYVRDATNTCNWFINYLDFQVVDLHRDRNTLTIVIRLKSILFVVSSPLSNNSIVAKYLASHAEGIADISFRIDDLNLIINNSQDCGIKVLQSMQKRSRIRYACVAGWDCLQHSLIETFSSINCYLLPNGKLRTLTTVENGAKTRFTFTDIDHIVLNVAQGKLSQAVAYYRDLFQLQIRQKFTIKTERSGLYSEALIDRNNRVQFNINEPTNQKSQIQEFIDLNGGSGIQHLALKSSNLIQDVSIMRKALQNADQVSFLSIPDIYYIGLKKSLDRDSIALSGSELESIIKQEILIDWHSVKSNSLLMQIFTQPILEKPTFFLEFIERRQQAKGFGEGNFKALFAAVEQSKL